MIRINTLHRCGKTLTIELMGYINKTEFDILYECLQSHVEEGVKEVCIVANEVRSLNPLLERELDLGGDRGVSQVRLLPGKTEASLDGSPWLYLGLELIGLIGLVLGFGWGFDRLKLTSIDFGGGRCATCS